MADPTRPAERGVGPPSETRADHPLPTDADAFLAGPPEAIDTTAGATLEAVSPRPREEPSDELTLADRPMRPTPDAGAATQAHETTRTGPGDGTARSHSASEFSLRVAPVIPGYEIESELGRGGMGVVYKARRVRLNRAVALKMILAGVHAGGEAAARFLAEAEAVAKLQHPNIVQIFHIDEHDGFPYFEMEYVEGGSLAERLDGTPRAPREAARLVETLARAMAEAHRQGVVHRDLKPGNILLTSDGTAKVADFGLAKLLNAESGLTRTDSILGSPSYMAPEQAEGKTKHVGPTADLYALGAILYELLTGRPPFRGATALDTLQQVKTAEPVPPSRLVPGLPRDVETICLKCLQKDPGKRYESATALTEDLRRFQAGEPIVARPVGSVERTWRWARRNPVIAAMGGVLTAVLVVGFAVMAILWSRAERSASIAKMSELGAQTMATKEAKARGEAQAQERIAQEKAELLAQEDYVNRIDRAYREVQDDNVALAEDLLHGCPSERRGWEWHYVKRLCHPERLSVDVPAGSLSAIAFSPDGRVIATGSGGQFSRGKGGSNVELWDRRTGRRRPTFRGTENVIWSLAFSPDGTRLALGGTNPQVEVRDAHTGAVLWSKSEPKLPQAMSIAFSPDGKGLAVGFGVYSQLQAFQVKIYEVETGRETVAFPGPKGGVNDLAFHPDGRRLAVAGSEVVEVWDAGGRHKVQELGGHSRWVYGVAYSPDGKWLATGGWDRTIRIRDATSGEGDDVRA